MEAAVVWIVVGLVALALFFDFVNGFNDAASSITTVVSTGALKLGHAVALAATFNFLALFAFGFGIASTVASGLVDVAVVDYRVLFATLLGALCYGLFTRLLGLTYSSTHALIGGLIGSVVAKAGFGALIGQGVLTVFAFGVLAPLLGLLLGGALMLALAWALRRSAPRRIDKWSRRAQLVSCALYSLGHGSNDAQRTLGLIWLLLITAGYASNDPDTLPRWAIVSCYAAISIGTLVGGWQIARSTSRRITKLKPVGGVCAETGGALALCITATAGIPVSTTHTITGAIMGVGTERTQSAVRWGIAGTLAWAWVLTIPGAAMMSAAAWWLSYQVF